MQKSNKNKQTACRIMKHIDDLPIDHAFTTYDFLKYGTRHAVDQQLYRMVCSGQIVRITAGVFIKSDGAKHLSVRQVASIVAHARGSEILPSDESSNGPRAVNQLVEHIFFTVGVTACFRVNDEIVRLKSTTPRKFRLRKHKQMLQDMFDATPPAAKSLQSESVRSIPTSGRLQLSPDETETSSIEQTHRQTTAAC